MDIKNIENRIKKNLQLQKKETYLDKVVKKLRCFWWKYVLYTISTGIILLFIASFVYEEVITITTMNSWVGVILGLVATIIGIISMFLSFYNLDQSIKTQSDSLNKIENIKKDIIAVVEKSSDKMVDEFHNNRSQKPDVISPTKGVWDNVE